ncbi:MAG: 2-amino-4-hydroxy-6-hydroxymethyldihydropteridine diphosphokinase [Candidatus Omnitrophica bacterium]|nr:2-amino-4-hydroxy-6-hydroxymethyldihydropteridine diphosphokinase [Candidatus Omnitrophota bacterium]
MVTCYIGIGSNLGDRRGYIDKAVGELKGSKDIMFKRSSSIYETDPVSDIPQGKFLNGVLEIATALTPRALLKELNRIEEKIGRRRTVKDAPREIDLDILYYGDEAVKEDGLVIPHPRLNEREFVLKGLRELGKVGA